MQKSWVLNLASPSSIASDSFPTSKWHKWTESQYLYCLVGWCAATWRMTQVTVIHLQDFDQAFKIIPHFQFCDLGLPYLRSCSPCFATCKKNVVTVLPVKHINRLKPCMKGHVPVHALSRLLCFVPHFDLFLVGTVRRWNQNKTTWKNMTFGEPQTLLN